MTRMGILVALMIVGCSAADQTISTGPPGGRGESSSGPTHPAPPSVVQQASGNVAANVSATVQAELSAIRQDIAELSVDVTGVSYASELPWKAVALLVLLNVSQNGLLVLIVVLSHRREMTRLRRAPFSRDPEGSACGCLLPLRVAKTNTPRTEDALPSGSRLNSEEPS